MPVIRVRDGNELFVRDVGRGSPVVLLHGFGSQGAHWLPNVLPLKSRYRFILPDLRGFGRSHLVSFNRPDFLSNHVEDIEDIVNALGIDRFALGGVSMGAYTALQYNRLLGFDRVTKYLHIDQSPNARNSSDWQYGLFGARQEIEFARFRELLKIADMYGRFARYWTLPADYRIEVRDTMANFLCLAFNHPIQHRLIHTLKHQERLMTKQFLVENWFAYLDVMRGFMDQDYDMRPTLPNIRIPVTMAVGMRSRMYPAQGQLEMAAALPNARVVRFQRAGHVPMLDQPLQFQATLTQFLAA